MSLDFSYTCPDIDKAITNITEHIDEFGDTLKDLGVFGDLEYYESKYLLNCIIEEIEDLRNLNSAMRDAADKQIRDLHSRIEELEEDNNRLYNEVDNLNYILEELEE